MYQEKDGVSQNNNILKTEETLLFEMLRKSLKKECLTFSNPNIDLNDKEPYEEEKKIVLQADKASEGIKKLTDTEWERLYQISYSHKVCPLLGEVIDDYKISSDIKKKIIDQARRTTLQNYRLLILSKSIYCALNSAGIKIVFLKGASTGHFYPVPELRKSGDIDFFLINKDDVDRAGSILEDIGFNKKSQQTALHHIEYDSTDGIEVEMHLLLAEPFDNSKLNAVLDEAGNDCGMHVVKRSLMDIELPVLADGYHAYELLVHMLQHFLRAGFGLKLLCDWVVFWNRDVEQSEKEIYLELVNKSGIKNFSDVVTGVCCEHLGLEKRRIQWMNLSEDMLIINASEFMRDVIDAEEFGNSSRDRMVALRGDSFADYIREFHYQMRLNFPKIGKIILFWPVLWVITFVRFMINNRKVRNSPSFREIMKNAGKRGKLVKQMHIFTK